MQPWLFVLMRAQPLSQKSRPRRKRIGFGRVEVTYSVGRSVGQAQPSRAAPSDPAKGGEMLGIPPRTTRRESGCRRAAVRSTGVKRCTSSKLTGVHTIKHLKPGGWRFPVLCILCAHIAVRSKYLFPVSPFFRPSFNLEIGRRNPRGATESSRGRPRRRGRGICILFAACFCRRRRKRGRE